MPKRKAETAHTADESPPAKKQKKSFEPKEHGETKAPKFKAISSNWKALSKSLGVSSTRKQDQLVNDQRQGTSDRKLKRKRKRQTDKCTKDKVEDIWFDDVPLECVNGELVASSKKGCVSTSLITGPEKSAGRCVGLDCEMVGTGPDGSYSMLARVCIVNHHGHTLYDTFVSPMDKVTDYRSAISGVSPKDLRGAPEFSVVQKQVSELLKDRVLVGHSVQNDLKALLLSHPKKDIRDTSKYRPFKHIAKTRYPSLKKLSKEILGIDIQSNEHNPVEDAQVAMKLYQLHKKEWETSVRERLTRREIRERKREKRREGVRRGVQRRNSHFAIVEPFNIMLHTDR